MGVDFGRHEDLIAYKRNVDEIREIVDADCWPIFRWKA